MENKGLLGFLIAGILAVVAALVYFLFFKKKASSLSPDGTYVSSGGALGASVGTIATNPINSQNNTGVTPPYVPINDSSILRDGDEQAAYSILSNASAGFQATPQETLTNGNALSQRSNNPGALFWDGSTNWQGMDKSLTKSGNIIYFTSVDYGVRAQLMTLKNYYKLHGIDTLSKITARYAPYGHGSNDPGAYARTLSSCLAVDVDTKFNMDVNRNMLAAVGYYMHRVEAGYFWVPRSKYLEWSTKV
jgi:hypothetical protein